MQVYRSCTGLLFRTCLRLLFASRKTQDEGALPWGVLQTLQAIATVSHLFLDKGDVSGTVLTG